MKIIIGELFLKLYYRKKLNKMKLLFNQSQPNDQKMISKF